jgi:hypothetical protein
VAPGLDPGDRHPGTHDPVADALRMVALYEFLRGFLDLHAELADKVEREL